MPRAGPCVFHYPIGFPSNSPNLTYISLRDSVNHLIEAPSPKRNRNYGTYTGKSE